MHLSIKSYKLTYQVRTANEVRCFDSLKQCLLDIGKESEIQAEYYISKERRLEDKKSIKPIPDYKWKGAGFYKDNKLVFGEKDSSITINGCTYTIESYKVYDTEPQD